MSLKLRTMILVVPVIVGLDQLTKHWISATIERGGALEIIEGFFRLTHARNPGAALGLFPGAPVEVFIGLTIAALALIVSFYRQVLADDKLNSLALSLILGGALGNLVDRVLRHEVIDFLQFDLGLFIFPDFNVADSAICIGVALLMLDFVASEGTAPEATAAPASPAAGERPPGGEA